MVCGMFPAGHQRAPLPPSREEASASTSSSSASSPRPAGQARAQRGSGSRDPFLDNVKFLTIVLVVCGHAWGPLREHSRAAEALYMTVFTFHMPAFIIVSGYLSRSFEGRPRQLKRLLTGIVFPYLLFEVLFTLFMRATLDPEREFSVTRPSYALWFLCALFIWRLTSPVWKLVRWPLPISLGIAALASTSPAIGGDFNLQRVLQFLPFFVLGMQMRPEHFQMFRGRLWRALAVPIVLGSMVVAYWASPRMNVAWFYHKNAAQDLGTPWWVGVVMTFALFGCALVLTACLFIWTPRRNTWFTPLGAGTMYAYLLHIYVLHLALHYEWYDLAWVDTPGGRVVVTVIAAVVGVVLCTTPVRTVFRPLIEPKAEWLFRQDATALARERERGGERQRSGTRERTRTGVG